MKSRDQGKEVSDRDLKKVEFLLSYDEVLKPYFEKGLIKLVNKPEEDFL